MQSDSPRDLTPAGGSISRARRRVLIYGPMLVLLALIQTTLSHAFPLLGMIPDLCLLFVLGVAMLDGAESGGAAGIAAGFLESALGGVGASLLPLLFFAIGYGAGHVAGKALARTFPSYMIFALALCFLRPAITLASIGLDARTSGFDLTAIFVSTLVPEFFANLIASIPMYPVSKKIHKWVQKKN